MNFFGFDGAQFDGSSSSAFTIASWAPTFPQPRRAVIYVAGTTFGWFPTVGTMRSSPGVPDPWRSTSARKGPDPSRGTAIRDPPNIVSSPPIYSYQAPPALPSNVGFKFLSVPDPRRSTSTPLYGPRPKPVVPTLAWQPTAVQPSRKVLYASGTDTASAVWPYPGVVLPTILQPVLAQPSRAIVNPPGTTFTTSLAELVFADKWQPLIFQLARPISRASGTDLVRPLQELIFADKWQPTTIQPNRQIVYAKGTDLATWLYDPTHADPHFTQWQPTWVQPSRTIVRAKGTDSVLANNEVIPLLNGQAVMGATYTISAASGVWVDTGFSIALPAAGTYLVGYNVRGYVGIFGLDLAYICAKLYQDDQSIDVPNSQRFVVIWDTSDSTTPAVLESLNVQLESAYSVIVTVISACSIHLYVKRIFANGTTSTQIQSNSDGYTTLNYVKIA